MGMKRKNTVSKVIQFVVLLIVAVAMMMPLYIVIVNMFKDTNLITRSPLSIPVPPTLQNLKDAIFTPGVNILDMYKNSVLISTLGMLGTILVAVPASYYMARSRSPLAKFSKTYFLMGLMVPYVIVYIPLCMMIRFLKIGFDMPTLVAVFISGNIPFSTFMYTNFMTTLPRGIEESAAIDGASRMQTLIKILFPLLKPCTATVVIFVFLSIWNDFMTPLLLGQFKTITVGIYTVIGPYSANWGVVFAYVGLATVPMIILFLLFQDQFISGLTTGATKG